MKIEGQDIMLSASDLMRFMGCTHATAMDLRYARGEPLTPAEDSEDAKILQKQGNDHESRFLARLKAERHSVIEFSHEENLGAAARLTRDALAQGAEVVFQGAFLSPPWGGWSDFLIRTEKSSKLGDFSYEVVDTKLKRNPDPKHILQLVLYSDLLAKIQGCEPDQAHIELGDGTRFSFWLPEYAAYARHARARLENFVARPASTFPEPVRMCGLCRWREDCDKQWDDTDSLALVAGISRSQRNKLVSSGVTTMTELGRRSKRVPRLAEATLAKLALQARLQFARRAGGPPTFELKALAPDRGLALLPEPDPGDVFYDIEGDPFYDGGLEYLHGIWFSDRGHSRFEDFWAHNRAEEGEALRRLMTFFESRLREFPKAHIYHYAAYEISALRRLTSTHGIGEALLDQMLREGRFVDLYSVVSGGIVASEPAYSLKNLEIFYMAERTGAVRTAGGSVVAYETWRETKDSKILEEIRDYNKMDCMSTQLLRDWVVASVRPAGMAWRQKGEVTAEKPFNSDTVAEQQAVADVLRKKLEPVGERLGNKVAELLFDLTYFHGRERKPAWWSIFDKIGKDAEDLIDDFDCLAGLVAKSKSMDGGKSWERTFEFPEQESKLDVGACHTELNRLPAVVTVTEIDQDKQIAIVKFPKAHFPTAPDQLSLLPSGPLKTDAIEAAIVRVVEFTIGNNRRYSAVLDFICKVLPRFRTNDRKNVVIAPNGDFVSEVVAAVGDLDRSVLPIQGPPGTGKTYVSSCAILELVRRGKRVGVASNSRQRIFDDSGRSLSGVHLVEVPHGGNGQSSQEEVVAIRRQISSLLGKRFRDRDGNERCLQLSDILVVAPYNLQVNALKAGLPSGARVGTVDKFQGQEAPVCIVSMTTSSGDEVPKGLDFLLSLNRINVAVSRAQVLSLVFASPRLLEIPCANIREMRLVNSLCALKEYSGATSEGAGDQSQGTPHSVSPSP